MELEQQEILVKSKEYLDFRKHYTKEINQLLKDNNNKFVMTNQITINLMSDILEIFKQNNIKI